MQLVSKYSKPAPLVVTARNNQIVTALAGLFTKFPTRAPGFNDMKAMNDFTDLVNYLPQPVIEATVKYFMSAEPPVYGKTCPNPTRFTHRAVRFVIEPAAWKWVQQYQTGQPVPATVEEVISNIRSLNQSFSTLDAKLKYLQGSKDGHPLFEAFFHYTMTRRAIEGRRYACTSEFVTEPA